MTKLNITTLALALAAVGINSWADDTPELNTPRRISTAKAKIKNSDDTVSYTVVNGRAMLGDIVLGNHDDVQRSGITWPALTAPVAKTGGPVSRDNHSKGARVWPNNTVVYMFDPSLSKAKRDAIAAGMQLISSKTAVRFAERGSEANFVRFVSEDGCWSYVGMNGGEQKISIGDGCERVGTVAHEITHALGWMHEQMRPDRDNYVRVLTENIQTGLEDQFTKLRADQVDPVGSYDIDSVMHYPSTAFSKNGQPTIVPLDSSIDPRRMGQRGTLSAGDIAAINKFYPANPGTVEFKMSASSSQLQLNQDKSGQITLNLAGSDSDLKSLQFSVQSDNSSVIASSGVVVQAGSGTQRTVSITPVAKAYGSANITVRATTAAGKQQSVTIAVTVAKDQSGGGTTPTTGAKPFDRSAKYVNGNQASLNGKTYTISVLINDAVVPSYWVWGSYCEPERCTAQAPFTYGGWLKIFWTPVDSTGTGTGTNKPGCDTVLDTQKQYVISSAGLRKSLVPAGDAQNAPLILWPDAGQQHWKLSRNAEGYYSVFSAATSLAIDVANGATRAGSGLIVWPAHGGANQQFCPKLVGSSYQLVSRSSSLPIGAAAETDGSAVVLSNGGFNWLLSPL
ncbi:M12 family metallopeptidase [Chitinimonas sp.]|uniref:M12 family metallopeptidase n=1 Tax=Chitinimonas sp. TaxID=1934313 RepID=UPI0035ADB798